MADLLTKAVARSADPTTVATAVARLSEAIPELRDRLETDAELRQAVVAIAGASRSLTDLCLTDPDAIEVLTRLDRRRELSEPAAVGRWKRLELLRIAARDLLNIDDLPEVGRQLSEMAADVLQIACSAAGVECLAVIAMGKLGGSELNYSSDIDILFVGDDPRGARAVLDLARTCFRVDVDLRPEGRDGPLVRSLESYEAYWDRWAQTWEFQALLKARPIAGDSEVGRRFFAAAQERVWGRPFTSEDLRAIRSMKARAETIVARRGVSHREVKRGRGGIRDVEFAVQLLQMVHGRSDPELRSPTTLDALAELGSAGYIDASDARALDHAYRVLRSVEHRLQLVAEQQVHTLPSDVRALDRLGRVMGYRATADHSAGEQLTDYLRRQQAAVRTIHEHLFFRPLLDTLTAGPSGNAGMTEKAVAARLSAFGFTEVERTRQALAELTHGLTRSSRMMQQLLPLLLGWLSESPDPDLGLLRLRVLTAGGQQAKELGIRFRESPEVARRLCLIIGTSRRLGEAFERNPDMIGVLGDADGLAPRSPDALGSAIRAALRWRTTIEERQLALLRFKEREELRVATADILDEPMGDGRHRVTATAGGLSDLAEACVDAALEALAPPLPFSVIALGRFGGCELSYASDLDLLFVYDGAGAEQFELAESLSEDLVRFMAGSTPVTRIYPVDLGLRPEGKDGPLARSLDGYQAYYRRWAQTWERQALVRARVVAGDRDLGQRFLAMVEPHVWRERLPDLEVREIRRMKARIERERIPSGEDPQFHLKLGPGSLSDVEFCAQLLQLQHRIAATGTMAAVDALVAAGVVDASDAAVLSDAYRFCERTRNRWFLVKGSPGDSLPSRPEQLTRLSRSLGTTPDQLRETYLRVTRRSRAVVERLFYGKGG